MGSTVFTNMMGISHRLSNAMSTVFTDVCKTPAGSSFIPVPYTNTAKSSTIAKGTKKVKLQGNMGAVKGCNYSVSTDDEPGTLGGIISGKFKSKAEFMLSSFDVKLEGKNACRNGDLMTHNDKNAMG